MDVAKLKSTATTHTECVVCGYKKSILVIFKKVINFKNNMKLLLYANALYDETFTLKKVLINKLLKNGWCYGILCLKDN